MPSKILICPSVFTLLPSNDVNFYCVRVSNRFDEDRVMTNSAVSRLTAVVLSRSSTFSTEGSNRLPEGTTEKDRRFFKYPLLSVFRYYST